MSRVQVKVCGITRLSDARTAVALGADMLGFIFVRRSPRFITVARATTISRDLPPTVDRVGVFVDEDFDKLLRAARRLRLDYVQLHGGETSRYIAQVRRAGFRTIRAFTVRTRSDYGPVMRCRADLVLLDHGAGGTGETFDWSLRPPRRIPNLILAGGLNSDNIACGIDLFKPLVVDVNSGVESAPGRKSRRKLAAFMGEVERLGRGDGRE